MDYQARWAAKRGNRDDEYEDAHAADASVGRFAVADGATESAFAAVWAQALVQHFANSRGDDADRCSAWLPSAQEQWQKGLRGKKLPWFAEAKAEQGAFATFLGVSVSAEAEGEFHWRAVAVGDSCLFHTRGHTLLQAFPIRRSKDFGNSPQLVGSRSPVDEVETRRTDRLEGTGRAGDRLWLMTDALSQWFLTEQESGGTPTKELGCLLRPPETKDRFVAWMNLLRDAKRIRNDDVTLLAVRLGTT